MCVCVCAANNAGHDRMFRNCFGSEFLAKYGKVRLAVVLVIRLYICNRDVLSSEFVLLLIL